MQAAVETMDSSWQGEKPQFEWCPVQHDENGQPSYKGYLSQRNTCTSQCEPHDHYSGINADDLAIIFLSMHDLIRGTKHVRHCFLLFGLKIHVGVRNGGIDGKDSDSKSLAMHVPKIQDRKNISQVLQSESYDLGDGTFIPFCKKFKYLGTMITCDLDDTTEIERRLSLAQMAFNESRKILCNQKNNVELRRQLYLMCVVSVALAGCETWAITTSHFRLLASFHHRCTRAMCGINLWHCRMHKITTESTLERLGILPIDKIFYTRQLKFLHRAACMDPSRLTFQTLSSQVVRVEGMKIRAGAKTNTLSTWRKTLEKAGLATARQGGKLEEWVPIIRSGYCPAIVEEKLGLPPNSFWFKSRPMHPHTHLDLLEQLSTQHPVATGVMVLHL
jgi:hypothetical protein